MNSELNNQHKICKYRTGFQRNKKCNGDMPQLYLNKYCTEYCSTLIHVMISYQNNRKAQGTFLVYDEVSSGKTQTGLHRLKHLERT